MEWIKENAGLFVLIMLIVLVIFGILLAFILRKVSVIVKNTVVSSLKENALVVYDSNKLEEKLVIKVYNTNFRDVIVSSFGFIYCNQSLDLVKEYVTSKGLKDNPVVPARSFIEFIMEPKQLEKFILENNFDKKNLDVVYNYVVDSVGYVSKSKNYTLTRALRKRNKARIAKAKVILHNEKVEAYKAEHQGKLPFSHTIWTWFHRKEVTIPSLIEMTLRLSHKDEVRVIGDNKTPVEIDEEVTVSEEIKPEEADLVEEETNQEVQENNEEILEEKDKE